MKGNFDCENFIGSNLGEGNSATGPVDVAPQPLALSAPADRTLYDYEGDGEDYTVTYTASGGTPPYTYTGTDAPNSNVLTVTGGTGNNSHTATVTDSEAATASATANVNVVDASDYAITLQDAAGDDYGPTATFSDEDDNGQESFDVVALITGGVNATEVIFTNDKHNGGAPIARSIDGGTRKASITYTQAPGDSPITVVATVTDENGEQRSQQLVVTVTVANEGFSGSIDGNFVNSSDGNGTNWENRPNIEGATPGTFANLDSSALQASNGDILTEFSRVGGPENGATNVDFDPNIVRVPYQITSVINLIVTLNVFATVDGGPEQLVFTRTQNGSGTIDETALIDMSGLWSSSADIDNTVFRINGDHSALLLGGTVRVFFGELDVDWTADTNDAINVLAAEDFNNLDDWTAVDHQPPGNNQTASNWQAVGGQLIHDNNYFSGGGADGSSVDGVHGRPYFGTQLVYGPGSAFTDYRFEIELESADDDGIGVMFRYVDDNNYYRFATNSERNLIEIGRCVGGTYTPLCIEPFEYASNQRYNVTVDCIGDYLYGSLSIGETVVKALTARDSSHNSGTVACYCWANNGVIFDNMEITDLTGASAPAAPAAHDPLADISGNSQNLTTEGTMQLVGSAYSAESSSAGLRVPVTGQDDYSGLLTVKLDLWNVSEGAPTGNDRLFFCRYTGTKSGSYPLFIDLTTEDQLRVGWTRQGGGITAPLIALPEGSPDVEQITVQRDFANLELRVLISGEPVAVVPLAAGDEPVSGGTGLVVRALNFVASDGTTTPQQPAGSNLASLYIAPGEAVAIADVHAANYRKTTLDGSAPGAGPNGRIYPISDVVTA